jgi:phosphohistidine phosphatase
VQPRRLVLVRHAKAADGPVDADRPLTGRGARRAAAIGTWLHQAGLVPDRVLVSSARRAVQTWEQAATELPQSPRPIVDTRIYDNTVEALFAVIRETPDDVRALVVVGHNPSIAELVSVLDDGQGTPAARHDAEAGVPTGGVAVFLLATPFAGIDPGAGTLDDFTVPGG